MDRVKRKRSSSKSEDTEYDTEELSSIDPKQKSDSNNNKKRKLEVIVTPEDYNEKLEWYISILGECFQNYVDRYSHYMSSYDPTLNSLEILQSLSLMWNAASEKHKAMYQRGTYVSYDDDVASDDEYCEKPPPYTPIQKSVAVGHIPPHKVMPESELPCSCPPIPGACGSPKGCLNCMMNVECLPDRCPAGDYCSNQRFTRKSYAKIKPFKTPRKGWGLKTLKDLTEGQFIIEYVGEIINEGEYHKRCERKSKKGDIDFYFLAVENSIKIDAEFKGNISRFLNHSCEPNCEVQKWTVDRDLRVGIFAKRNIRAHEELTFDYKFNVDEYKQECYCDSVKCVRVIGGKKNETANEMARRLQWGKDRETEERKSKNRMACYICCGVVTNKDMHCKIKTCKKSYHLSCLEGKENADDEWMCPCHKCHTCHKRTTCRCIYCPRAYCKKHAPGKIRFHQYLGLLCTDHDEPEIPGSPDDDEEEEAFRKTNGKKKKLNKLTRPKCHKFFLPS